MKKLIVLVMCLTLVAAYAFAEDGINIRVNGSNALIGDGKYTNDADLPEVDSPRCPSCESLIPCGSPTETENNDTCGNPDVLELTCGSIVYGKVCDDNSDYFRVNVPGYTELVVTLFDGNNCDRSPAVYARMKPYYSNCEPAANEYTDGTITATNEGFEEFSFLVRVKRDLNENSKYSLVVACEQIIIPCPDGMRNYCADPIIIPAGLPLVNGYYHYENNENSCCAENIVECINAGGEFAACGFGSCYASGPDIVYELNLSQETILRIETGVIGGGDTQFSILTDCTDPTTCVASQDNGFDNTYGFNAPEIVENLTLAAGTYYIITSMYGTDQCNDIYIIIDGDHELPVELTSFDAVAGNASVTLNWSTGSETDNDHFDIVRDGTTVGRVIADNRATGSSYSWTEENLANGRAYSYELISVDVNGTMNMIAEGSATPNFDAVSVTEYALHQNYPNPFNPETSISFDLADAGAVSLTVFNPLGQTVATLVNGTLASGRHTVAFDGTNLTSGLYYYRLEAGDFSAIRKMVLMK
jgi:hypothetical protein